MIAPFLNYRVINTAATGSGEILIETMTKTSLVFVEFSGDADGGRSLVYHRGGFSQSTGDAANMLLGTYKPTTSGATFDVQTFSNLVPSGASIYKLSQDEDAGAVSITVHIFELPTTSP